MSFEWEAILNNRSLTIICPTDLTSFLIPNHLLYDRVILSSSMQYLPLIHDPSELTAYSTQITAVINRFGDKWRYACLVNLRVIHKYYCTNKNQPFIPLNDVVLVDSNKISKSMWRMVVVTELIKGRNQRVRSRREAAEMEEFWQRFAEWTVIEILDPYIWWIAGECENCCTRTTVLPHWNIYFLSNTCKYFI